jgi:hypothetical protein
MNYSKAQLGIRLRRANKTVLQLEPVKITGLESQESGQIKKHGLKILSVEGYKRKKLI